jgi:hypothetical protein
MMFGVVNRALLNTGMKSNRARHLVPYSVDVQVGPLIP